MKIVFRALSTIFVRGAMRRIPARTTLKVPARAKALLTTRGKRTLTDTTKKNDTRLTNDFGPAVGRPNLLHRV